MTIEAATYLNQLNPSYPDTLDTQDEGDNHLRLLKQVLQNTFPNLTGAVTPTQAQLNTVPDLAPKASPTFTSGVTVSTGDVVVSAGDLSVVDGVTGSVTLDNSGGIEIFGTAARIDFKNASGDDYDVRISQSAAGSLTITGTDQVVVAGAGFVSNTPPANQYGVWGQPTSVGYGGVIGFTQNGLVNGILGHANQYSFHGTGELYNSGAGTFGGALTVASLVSNGTIRAANGVYSFSDGSEYIQWSGSTFIFSDRIYGLDAYRSVSGYMMPCQDARIGRWVVGSGVLDVVVDGIQFGITISPSDARVKENIQPTKVAALTQVEAMHFVEFDFVENSLSPGEHRTLGLIAQDLEAIDPACVIQADRENDGLRQLNIEALALRALKAVQELTLRVKELETQLGALRGRPFEV